MDPLTHRDLRDLLFAAVAIDLGYARTRDVARALASALAGTRDGQASIREALTAEAALDPEQIEAIATAVKGCLAAAAGDAHRALEQVGGLPSAVHTRLPETVSLGLAEQGVATGDHLRETPRGRYVDFERVGAGGMGIVYLALDSDLNREVAFKIVNPRAFAGASPAARTPSQLSPPEEDTPASEAFATLKARFMQEALITGHLSHPSIVPVYEVGQTPGGVPYYTMKFVRGERTLADEIAAAETLEDRLGLLEPFLDLCDAVAYAHEQGVIHRDLKPGNVQRGSFGETVLLDWGLARTKDAENEEADDRWRQRIAEVRGDTGLRTVGILGTPGYMAPEALQGDPSRIDERSDQYSLGVVLFQILTGRLPHELDMSGDRAAAFSAYRRVVRSQDAPRADRLDASVPPEVACICARALARGGGDRFGSVSDLAGALRAWQRESARRQRRAERRAAAARTGLAGVALLLAVVGAFLWRTEALRRRARRSELRAVAAGVELDKQLDQAYWLAHEGFAQGDPVGQLLVAVAGHDHAVERGLDSRRRWGWEAIAASRTCPAIAGVLRTPPPLRSFAYAPSGRLVATGGPGGRVHVWEAESGRLLRSTDPHPNRVLRLTFSPDCATLASACLDSAIRLWDVGTGSLRTTLRGHVGSVTDVAFSSDCAMLVSGGADRTVRLWDVARSKETAALEGHTTPVNCVAFHPLGGGVASGSGYHEGSGRAGECAVKLWDLETRRETRTLEGHSGMVTDVTFSPDGTKLASAGSNDATVKLWDVATGRAEAALEGDLMSVSHVAFSPDGATLAAAARGSDPGGESGQCSIKLWGLSSHREVGRLRHSASWARGLAFSRDGGALICAGSDGALVFWDLSGDRLHATLSGHATDSEAVAFSPDGMVLASGGKDATLRLWDVATGREMDVLTRHAGWVHGTVFSPDGTVLASTDKDGVIKLWDVATGREAASVNGHSAGAMALDMSPDGTILATGGNEGFLKLWDAVDLREKATVKVHDGRVKGLSFSPDGAVIATAGNDRAVRLWDVSTRRRLAELSGHTNYANSVSFSSDGSALASGGDGTVRLWDVRSGRETAALEGHSRPVNSVCFAPDGTVVASGSADRTVRLWDVATGIQMAVLTGHTGGVSKVRFSPDGATIASTSNDRTVRLWDVSRMGVPTMAAAERLVGARLAALQVRALPPSSPDTPVQWRWGPRNPARWSAGVRRGEAEALYRLGVIREREQDDSAAADLLRRAASTGGDGQEMWAAMARKRLATIPWLRDPEAYELRLTVRREASSIEELTRRSLCSGEHQEVRDRVADLAELAVAGARSLAAELARDLVDDAWESYRGGAYDKAERLARLAVELDPLSPRGPNALGWMLRLRGDLAAGAAQLRHALTLDPTYWPVHSNLASVLQPQRRFDDAVVHYRLAVALGPIGPGGGSRHAGRSAARLDSRAGRHEEAIDGLKQWLSERPEDLSAAEYLAVAYYRAGRHPDADAVLADLTVGEKPRPRAVLLAALCARAKGGTDGARGRLGALWATDAAVRERRMRVAVRDLLDWDIGAEEGLLEVASGDPALVGRARVALALGHARRALLLARAGDRVAAQRACGRAVASSESDSSVRLTLGQAYSELGMADGALRHLTKAVELNPDSAVAHTAFGRQLCRLGRGEEARAAFQRALTLNAESAGAHTGLALVHLVDRDLGKAMVCLERGLASRPAGLQTSIADLKRLLERRDDLPEAHYALASLYEQQRDGLSAQEHYRQYVEAVSAGPHADAARQRLARLSPAPSAERGGGVRPGLADVTQQPVPALAALLRSPDHRVRLSAAAELGRRQREQGGRALAETLQGATAAGRLGAVLALTRPGERSAETVPALMEALEDDDARVALAAHCAVAEITGEPLERLPSLIEGLVSAHEGIRESALRSLSGARPQVESAQGALLFDGVGDHIRAPGLPFDTWESFTVECWVMGWRGLVMSQGMVGDTENSIWLSVGPDCSAEPHGTCGWGSGDGGGHQQGIGDNLGGVWNHVAMVYDGRRQLLLANGQLVHGADAPRPGPLDSRRLLFIGVHLPGIPGQFGSGFLRSLRISNTARYSEGFSPPETLPADEDAVLLYDFSEQRQTPIPDRSGHDRPGVLHTATGRVRR